MPHAAFATHTPQSRTNTPPVQPTWHDEVEARDATEAVRCEEAGAVCSEGVLKVDRDLIDGHLLLPTALFKASDGSKEGDASPHMPSGVSVPRTTAPHCPRENELRGCTKK